MKIYIRQISMILLIILSISFSSNISYGINMTSDPQIDLRGLTFSKGKSSDQIRFLKDFFRARGEENVPWGYDYDNRIKELVMNYQKSVGLKADGIVGKPTIDRINKEIRENKYNIGLRIMSTDIKGHMIVINKSSNTLYFLKNGEIQESYPVATGKTVDLTPNGKFKVVIKAKNPRWGGAGVSEPIDGGAPNNPLGKRWIGISYGGGGRYGVHGNSNRGSIGTYASLGCVRMLNEDVEKLYEKVKINTPVWIGNEEILTGYGVKFKSNYKSISVPAEEKIPQKEIILKLNGEEIALRDSVINKDGTTYYPFREILELVNAQAIWDSENKKVIGILRENYVEFYVDSNEYISNNEYKYLPEGQKVFINQDKTYIPIRNLMESLGYAVYWDQLTSTVRIDSIILEEETIPLEENLPLQEEYVPIEEKDMPLEYGNIPLEDD